MTGIHRGEHRVNRSAERSRALEKGRSKSYRIKNITFEQVIICRRESFQHD